MMKTLNARTVTARSVACVNKGSPETEEHVKVLDQFFTLALLLLNQGLQIGESAFWLPWKEHGADTFLAPCKVTIEGVELQKNQ